MAYGGGIGGDAAGTLAATQLGAALPIFLLPPWRPPFHDLRIVGRNILPRDLRRPPAARGLMGAGDGRRSSFDRLPRPLCGGLRGGSRLVAFPFCPRAQRTLGRQLLLHPCERFLDLRSLCIDSLRHLVSCKALMAELCLEVVDGIAGIRQQSLGFLAGGGLLSEGLPGGVQLLEAAAAVTVNDSDGNIAVARKVTSLVWPIRCVGRMRHLGHGRCFSA
jgi:hypothetical protein